MTTAKRDLIVPTVHLNGTSAETLTDNLCEVYSAIGDAIRKLKQAAPNGRDYYLEPGSLERATDQHMRRMKTLTDLQDELQAEIEAIEDQS